MRLSDFDVYRDLLREHSGTVITQDKTSLLDSRLSPVAKRWGYASVELMTLSLKAVPEKQLVHDVVDAITNHETGFLRNYAHIEILKENVFPYFSRTLQPFDKMKIWSLGCSTGQEPYSIAFALKDSTPQLTENTEILASDMSGEILGRARDGIYSQYEVQRGLPIRSILKYFIKDGENWHVVKPVKKMIRFETFNLLKNMDRMGEFHVIFCQNLLGSLDPQIRKQTLENLGLRLARDGFLFVNDVADVPGETDRLAELPGHPGIYVRPGSPVIGRF